MSIILSSQDPNSVVERVALINRIENRWGICQQLGLFSKVPVSQRTVDIALTNETSALIEDTNYEARVGNLAREQRQTLAVKVPHYGVGEAILAADIDGKVNFEQLVSGVSGGVQLETVADVRIRKMNRIRRSFADLLEYSRMKLITTGDVYAPNGTLKTSYGNTYNVYTEMGVTQLTEAFPLNDATKSPLPYCNEVRAKAQDGMLSGGILSGFVGFASPEFFDKLTGHAIVQENARYLRNEDLLMRGLPSGMGLDGRYQVFDYGGIFWIRVSDAWKGLKHIPANKAYVLPMTQAGDMFQTYFAPALKFSTVNLMATQEVYYFEKTNDWDSAIDIQAESNFLNWNLYPQAVVECTIQP